MSQSLLSALSDGEPLVLFTGGILTLRVGWNISSHLVQTPPVIDHELSDGCWWRIYLDDDDEDFNNYESSKT